MLKEYQNLFVRAHKLLDVILTIAAYVGAYGLKKYLLPFPYRGLIDIPNYTILGLLITIIWYISFNLFGMYSSYRNQTFTAIFQTMLKSVFTGILFLGLCLYIFKITDVSRIMIGLFFLLNITILTLSKGIVYAMMKSVRKRGYNYRNILLVGDKEAAAEVIEAIQSRAGSGYKVLGSLDVNSEQVGKKIKEDIPVLGTVESMEEVLREHVVDQVIFCPPLRRIKDMYAYLLLAEQTGIPARILPDWQINKTSYKPKTASFHFETFLDIPTLTLTNGLQSRGTLLIKSILDRVLAFLAFVLFCPFFLCIPVAIKAFSKGPVFFTQKRLGRNGRPFTMIKFRTMTMDAEQRRQELETLNETDGPVFKMKKDPRVIPFIGSFLRKRGLDELPQLLNVLRGEMSMVGPRPPIPGEVKQYDVWQRRRLSMKPGITCLWQVTPHRNDMRFGDWMKLDLAYIDNWSLWLDFKILLKTAWMMLRATGK